MFMLVCYILAKSETVSNLSKANSGLDESNSGFRERGSHPEQSTARQIEISSNSNTFKSDLDNSASNKHALLVLGKIYLLQIKPYMI